MLTKHKWHIGVRGVNTQKEGVMVFTTSASHPGNVATAVNELYEDLEVRWLLHMGESVVSDTNS